MMKYYNNYLIVLAIGGLITELINSEFVGVVNTGTGIRGSMIIRVGVLLFGYSVDPFLSRLQLSMSSRG